MAEVGRKKKIRGGHKGFITKKISEVNGLASEEGDPFWPVKNWPVIFRPVKFGQLFYAN